MAHVSCCTPPGRDRDFFLVMPSTIQGGILGAYKDLTWPEGGGNSLKEGTFHWAPEDFAQRWARV